MDNFCREPNSSASFHLKSLSKAKNFGLNTAASKKHDNDGIPSLREWTENTNDFFFFNRRFPLVLAKESRRKIKRTLNSEEKREENLRKKRLELQSDNNNNNNKKASWKAIGIKFNNNFESALKVVR